MSPNKWKLNHQAMNNKIKIGPKWARSSEEIWRDHFEKLTSAQKMKKFRFAVIKEYAIFIAAAAFFILLLIPGFYTKSVISHKGEHISQVLPDGSVVNLNAESQLSYKPLIWFVNRKVKMEGEAFFEVEKGSKFIVKTKNGDIRVLGTKFNVFSRDDEFSVACINGRVEVTSGNIIILEKGESVGLSGNGTLVTLPVSIIENAVSWKDGVFYFTSVPLNKVLEEIMRQYDVEIEYIQNSDYIYTGNFSKENTIDEVLEIVSLPFGLHPEKGRNGYKLVSQ